MTLSRSDRKALSTWVAEALPLDDLGFAQADVDEIGVSQPLGPPAIVRAQELFVGLVSELAERSPDTGALLTVPLDHADHLDTIEPSITDILAGPWTRLQVPALYVLDHGFFDRWDPVEQYIKPIRWATSATRQTAAYYRCWRANEIDPEYERSVYLRTVE